MSETKGIIDNPIKPDPNRTLRHIIAPDGKPSKTEYTVTEVRKTRSLVTLRPITGRSHQLRVHLASIGHPILGDRFYGDATTAKRLMLHAQRIEFHHPYSGKPMAFEAQIDWEV